MSGFTFTQLDDLERAADLPWIARLVLPEILPIVRAHISSRAEADECARLREEIDDLENQLGNLEGHFEEAVGQSHQCWEREQWRAEHARAERARCARLLPVVVPA